VKSSLSRFFTNKNEEPSGNKRKLEEDEEQRAKEDVPHENGNKKIRVEEIPKIEAESSNALEESERLTIKSKTQLQNVSIFYV